LASIEKFNKYIGFPWKHFGINPEAGIDCFNLIVYVFKQELNIDIGYYSFDKMNIAVDNWFDLTTERPFENVILNEGHGWERVYDLQPFDVIVFNLRSGLCADHCGLYIGNNQFLHIILKESKITTYSSYYKQYTTGIGRWKQLIQS